jgi:hypothetical protein
MERIVALVEGHMETHFVRSTYGNAVVQRPFPNGRTVDLDLIVESIRDQLETVGGDITKVVILLDREGRDIPAPDMLKYLQDELGKCTSNRNLYIGVSDRQIENWVVADEDHMREKFDAPNYQYVGDGTSGRTTLEKLNGGDAGYRDKAYLLKSCSATGAARRSPSLAAFLQIINFDWGWATS